MKTPGDLVARVGVAIVGIPVILGGLWLGGPTLGALITVAAVIGTLEFYRMLEAKGTRPLRGIGLAGSAMCVVAATIHPSLHDVAQLLVGILVALTLVALAAAIWRRWPEGEPTSAVTGTLGGILYVGLPLAFVPMLRAIPEQSLVDAGDAAGLSPLTAMSLILLPLLTTWAGDSAAYFTGHAIGRNKLAPAVSPGKTIEGSIGGLIGATAASVLVTMWWINPHPTIEIHLGVAAAIGATIGVATQLGDLVESLLKREAGIKDSGSIFPGHGGMLDRLDALLWAFPVTWLLLALAGVSA